MTKAFEEYMRMADKLYVHLKNKTQETEEEAKRITKRQEVLWNEMTDEEKLYADEQVLRTAIYVKS